MSGFVPLGYVKLLDVVAEHGAEYVGWRQDSSP
jgi:hypothetical protein